MSQAAHTTATPFMNVDFRDDLRPCQKDDDIEISGEELLEVLSCFNAYGRWRFDIAMGSMTWSEDVYRLHDMPVTAAPVGMKTAVSRYHPEDRQYLPALLDDAISNKSGFQFALRIKSRRDTYKLVHAVGKYREHPTKGPQIIGAFCERQPAMRMIGAAV